MYAKVRKRTWKTSKGEEKTAWIVDYKDQSGVRALRTFAKKGEAVEFETNMRGEVRDKKHVIPSKSITIKTAGKEWIEAVKRGRGERGPAEASTLRQYQYHLDDYIAPALGETLLAKLSKADVAKFRDDLLAKISRPLARKVLTSLKGILSESQHRDRVIVNVASAIKIGTGGRHKEDVVVPTIADVRAILQKLDELATQSNRRWADAWTRRRALLATAIHTGFRASEVRGLPWDAVDLKAGKIEVKQRADENGVIGPPKSKAGRRTISVPSALVAVLREWKMKSNQALAFPSEEGNPQSLPNIYNRAWKPVQLAAGVAEAKRDKDGSVVCDKDGKPVMDTRYNFHALRHFHASMLIADGANPKEVQVEMGHGSIQVTYDLYGHLFQDEDADRRRKERSERLAGMLD